MADELGLGLAERLKVCVLVYVAGESGTIVKIDDDPGEDLVGIAQQLAAEGRGLA